MSSVMFTVIWTDFGYGNIFVLLKLDAIWTSWVVLTLDVADEVNIIYIHSPLCRLPSTSLNASVYLEDFDKLLEWDKHDLLNNSR